MNATLNFSVLISVYKGERSEYLKEALLSIYNQTYLANEVLIVADGMLTQELYCVINEFLSIYQGARLLQLPTNLGLGLALNEGVKECKYEVIARMDSDDIIPSDRFEKQLQLVKEGYDVVSCWSSIFINDINNVIAIKKRPSNHSDIEKLAHRRSPVCHAACMYKKIAVINAGNYVHRLYYEDYHLWVRMILNGSKFYNIQESLYFVRTTNEQVYRRGGLRYLMNELNVFFEFYKMGFYSKYDLIINSLLRIPIRLVPGNIRGKLMSIIWNK